MEKTFFDASSYRCLPATTGLDAVKQNPVFAFQLKLNGEVFFQHSQHALHITGLEEPGYVRFLKVFIQEDKLDTGISLYFLDDVSERLSSKNEIPFLP